MSKGVFFYISHIVSRRSNLGFLSSYSMRRVFSRSKWTLFDSVNHAGLSEANGANFESLYRGYEMKNTGHEEVDAYELWNRILKIQIKTGGPAIIFRDSVNSECTRLENSGGY